MLRHALPGLPYRIRVLTTSLAAMPQDVIDAAENLGRAPGPGTIPTVLYPFLGYNFIRTNASVAALVLIVPKAQSFPLG